MRDDHRALPPSTGKGRSRFPVSRFRARVSISLIEPPSGFASGSGEILAAPPRSDASGARSEIALAIREPRATPPVREHAGRLGRTTSQELVEEILEFCWACRPNLRGVRQDRLDLAGCSVPEAQSRVLVVIVEKRLQVDDHRFIEKNFEEQIRIFAKQATRLGEEPSPATNYRRACQRGTRASCTPRGARIDSAESPG